MKKKIITTIVGSLIVLVTINAQVIQGYSFESAIGAYSEITGGTAVWQGADTEENTLTSLVFYSPTEKSKEKVTNVAGIPIGFDFVYDNQVMNKFAISSHGAIILGKDNVTVDPAPASLLATSANISSNWEAGKLDVLGSIMTGTPGHVYGNDNTEISYKVEGTTPGRVLVVQFKNYQVPLDNFATIKDEVNLQIRLYEQSNKIEFVYKDWNHSGMSRSFRTGLKGSSPENVHLRGTAVETWGNTTKSLDINISWSSTISIPDNLTFTFTPPADCVTPADQPTDLILTSTTIGIGGSFTASASADHYLTVISNDAVLSVAPQDGQYYKAGDVLGNGTVIGYDTIKSFATPDNLSAATTYYIYVLAANSYCAFGPKYNSTNPLTASATTSPAEPAAFSVVDAEYDKITLSVTANSANPKVLIATVDEAATWSTSIYQYGQFGTPTGDLNVGDSIEGGGVVIYKGDATDNLVLENLENNKIYHFGAWTWGGEQTYSSTFLTADTLTWGKVPLDYENFKAYPNFTAPFGWETYGTKTFQINRYQVLECQLSAANTVDGNNNGFITQWILLSEEANRALIDIQFQEYLSRSWRAYNIWDEQDTLQISVSEDGETFIPIYTISMANNNIPTSTTATNNNTSQFPKLNIPFTELSGKRVKLKVDWLTYKNARMYIANIKINEKPLCDYPLSLTVDNSSIVSDKALIDWTPDGDATIWEVHYRVKGSEEWSTPIETNTHPYLLTGLPYQSEIELQVRSKCSMTSLSPWSDETLSFISGYNLPFGENFEAGVLPAGWRLEKGPIADSTEFCTGLLGCQKYWEVNNNTLNIAYSNASYQWAILPLLDFGDGSVNYTFDFDLTVTPGENAIPNTDSLSVVVSKDGGKTFSVANILEKYDILGENAVATDGKVHHSIVLNGYTGVLQFAFYATGNGEEQIAIDNIGVLESCPAAINAEVSDISGDEAKITWEGTADEWLVFVRQVNETTKDYQVKTTTEWILTDLNTATTYEVGITRSCSEGDTARIVIVTFTTLATVPCDEVENIQVEPSQTSAIVSWAADAANYNIKFRLKDAETWFERTSQTNSITLSGLEPDTKYEYTIQAVCSPAVGDSSDWSETAIFTTLPITCFQPTNVTIVPEPRSVTVTWASEADDYEIAYRTGNELWIHSLIRGSKTATINNLTPETAYSFRIRAICAENDTSEWTTTSFTTTAIPPCVSPSNLQATGITATSATLTWDADAANLTWDVRYRLGSITSYTTVTALTEATYQLQDLTPAEAYVWGVKASCEENTSGWISGDLITLPGTKINTVDKGAWNVFSSGKTINVSNPERTTINRIRLYDVNGLIIADYEVNTNENVLIPEATRLPVVIVKVEGPVTSATFKVLIK
jgi:hypothetical protein